MVLFGLISVNVESGTKLQIRLFFFLFFFFVLFFFVCVCFSAKKYRDSFLISVISLQIYVVVLIRSASPGRF